MMATVRRDTCVFIVNQCTDEPETSSFFGREQLAEIPVDNLADCLELGRCERIRVSEDRQDIRSRSKSTDLRKSARAGCRD